MTFAPTPDATPVAPLVPAWQPGFAALGSAFFTPLRPTPLPQPHWVGTSAEVGALLGLPEAWQQRDDALQAFTGNALLPGSQPLASVYSGHQFGGQRRQHHGRHRGQRAACDRHH